MPTGIFDDSYFHQEANQPAFEDRESFLGSTQKENKWWTPSDFDMLIDYTPANKDGVMEIVVKAEAVSAGAAEKALRDS